MASLISQVFQSADIPKEWVSENSEFRSGVFGVKKTKRGTTADKDLISFASGLHKSAKDETWFQGRHQFIETTVEEISIEDLCKAFIASTSHQFQVNSNKVAKLLNDKEVGLLHGSPLLSEPVLVRYPDGELILVAARHRSIAILLEAVYSKVPPAVLYQTKVTCIVKTLDEDAFQSRYGNKWKSKMNRVVSDLILGTNGGAGALGSREATRGEQMAVADSIKGIVRGNPQTYLIALREGHREKDKDLRFTAEDYFVRLFLDAVDRRMVCTSIAGVPQPQTAQSGIKGWAASCDPVTGFSSGLSSNTTWVMELARMIYKVLQSFEGLVYEEGFKPKSSRKEKDASGMEHKVPVFWGMLEVSLSGYAAHIDTVDGLNVVQIDKDNFSLDNIHSVIEFLFSEFSSAYWEETLKDLNSEYFSTIPLKERYPSSGDFNFIDVLIQLTLLVESKSLRQYSRRQSIGREIFEAIVDRVDWGNVVSEIQALEPEEYEPVDLLEDEDDDDEDEEDNVLESYFS